MKTFKESIAFCILNSAFCVYAHAQIVYTDIIPDTSLGCPCGSSLGCNGNYIFDLNHDGNNDYTIYGSYNVNATWCNGVYTNYETCGTSANSLDSNEIASINGTNAQELNANDTIGVQLFWTLNYFQILQYYYHTPSCASGILSYWTDTGFVGLKLKVGNQHYYGWARVQLPSFYGGSYFTVYDYAYNSVPNQFILAGDTGTGTTGITTLEIKKGINIFPNPGNGKINITSSNNIDKIEITNPLGQIIYRAKPNEKNISLQIENDGIYFISIKTDKQITTRKLIVQR